MKYLSQVVFLILISDFNIFMQAKVVKVKWIDSCPLHGWNSKESFANFCEEANYECLSVGLLVFEDDNFIVLLQTIGIYQVSETMKIPKVAIKEMHKLGTPIEIDLNI